MVLKEFDSFGVLFILNKKAPKTPHSNFGRLNFHTHLTVIVSHVNNIFFLCFQSNSIKSIDWPYKFNMQKTILDMFLYLCIIKMYVWWENYRLDTKART
jgi:hypothetical protein